MTLSCNSPGFSQAVAHFLNYPSRTWNRHKPVQCPAMKRFYFHSFGQGLHNADHPPQVSEDLKDRAHANYEHYQLRSASFAAPHYPRRYLQHLLYCLPSFSRYALSLPYLVSLFVSPQTQALNFQK